MRENKLPMAFEEILSIPDKTLDALPAKALQGLMDSIDKDEFVEMQLMELRDAGVTVDQVRQLQLDLYNTVDDFKNQIDFDSLSPRKQEILSRLTEVIIDAFEEVCQRYELIDAKIPTQLLRDGAVLPEYAHPENDGGADVYVTEEICIKAHTYGNLVPSGFACAIPKGWMLSVRPRSGMSMKTPLRISNTPGTIERGFYSEIGILVDNFSDQDVVVKKGDRIAQLVLERRFRGAFVRVDELNRSVDNRTNAATGKDGFGSSDPTPTSVDVPDVE